MNCRYKPIPVFVLVGILLPGLAMAAPLDEADVRRIFQEEFAKREEALQERERVVSERERAVEMREIETAKPLTRAPGATSLPVSTPPSTLTSSAAVPEDSSVNLGNVALTSVNAFGPFVFDIEGYGEMRFTNYDYSERAFEPEGSRGQSRRSFDSNRFVLEFEGNHQDAGISMEAELEFEHNGAGSTIEYEIDEFGEYEVEVERGGEVVLEELYLEKFLGDGYFLRAGRFYVPVGILPYFDRPTDYLALVRPETEQVIIPGQWDELGFSARKEWSGGRVLLQVVNGLDSSGFSASRWIAGGHETRFEGSRAQDLALSGRIDFNTILPKLILGTSFYVGNSAENRTKDDVDVDATVVITSAHARYWGKDLRAQGSVTWGHLSDAREISDRNSRLPNSLAVERTPVADEAFGAWGEVGYDVAAALGYDVKHEVFPFVRFDYYDTYFDTRDDLLDNPRFERTIYTLGLTYLYDRFAAVSLQAARKDYGLSSIGSDDLFRFVVGFSF